MICPHQVKAYTAIANVFSNDLIQKNSLYYQTPGVVVRQAGIDDQFSLGSERHNIPAEGNHLMK